MTDIVVTDGLQLFDQGGYQVANKFTSNAIATDAITGDFSRYHLELTSDGVGSDEVLSLMTPISLTSDAVATSTATPIRVENCVSNGVAVDSFLQITGASTINLTSDALALDQINAAALMVSLTSDAIGADTLTMYRVQSESSDAVASADLVVLSKATLSFTSNAQATDSLDDRRTLALTSDAVGADSIVFWKIAREELTSDAVAAETLIASGRSILVLESDGTADSTATVNMVGTISLSSDAEAYDAVRLPAAALPGLWSNTTTGAAATWDGLPFNSMIEVAGLVYGAGLDGLYLLTPKVNDNGAKIDAEVLWDLDDLGTPAKKRVGHVYVAGYAAKPFVVTVITWQGRFEYETRLPKGEHATNYRANTGRGLDAEYYRVGVKAPGYFDVKGVIIDFLETARRI